MQNKAPKTIAIIGGGAAGLMACITAAKEGAIVHLYEQNKTPAKKILASGNGRCNISNARLSTADYFGEKPEFADFCLKNFTFSQLQKFCKSIGLFLNVLDDGRAYPLSNEAKSVALSFESFAKSCGVELISEKTITEVEKTEGKFYLHTAQNTSQGYDRVLIATGSEAAPQLGGSAAGYAIAEAFGHTIVATYPSLVQLHLNSSIHEKIAGAKQEAEVTLYLNGKKEQTIKGDILFTKYGISGFAILDISQKASQALIRFERVSIGLDLLPLFDRQTLSTQLLSLSQSLNGYTIETLLSGLLSIKIAHALLEDAKIAPATAAKGLSVKMAKQIVSKIKDWRFEVKDTHGFKHAEVSGGGVSTEEVNTKTMESLKCKGLYFAGEVLDIVGRRGGYNFHFAWASGYLAAKEMANNVS
jgi:predicted Rossmann fold flavoprotein